MRINRVALNFLTDSHKDKSKQMPNNESKPLLEHEYQHDHKITDQDLHIDISKLVSHPCQLHISAWHSTFMFITSTNQQT